MHLRLEVNVRYSVYDKPNLAEIYSSSHRISLNVFFDQLVSNVDLAEKILRLKPSIY